LEECCKEQGLLAEASEEGLGSKGAVVPMMMYLTLTSPQTEGTESLLPEKN